MTRGVFRGKLFRGYQGWYIRRGSIFTCVVMNRFGFWEIGLIEDARPWAPVLVTAPLMFRTPGPRTAGVAFKEAKRLSWLASKIGIEAVTHRW